MNCYFGVGNKVFAIENVEKYYNTLIRCDGRILRFEISEIIVVW